MPEMVLNYYSDFIDYMPEMVLDYYSDFIDYMLEMVLNYYSDFIDYMPLMISSIEIDLKAYLKHASVLHLYIVYLYRLLILYLTQLKSCF